MLAVTVVCSVAFSQRPGKELPSRAAPAREPPIFHGMKLGLTLGSQLSVCNTHFDTIGDEVVDGRQGELCFSGNGTPNFIEILRCGTTLPSTDESDEKRYEYVVSVLMPPNSDDIADGTVESVTLEYGVADATDVLTALKSKYGQRPICEKSAMQTGIGIRVPSVTCRWATSWGGVYFMNPWTTINTLSVLAATTKYEDNFLTQRRKDLLKKKSEF